MALAEDAGHTAVRSADGLVDEVDEDILQGGAGLPLEGELHPPANDGLARGVHAVEQLEEVLPFHLGKDFPGRPAKKLPVSDEGEVGSVGQLEDVLAAPHAGHAARSVVEEQGE